MPHSETCAPQIAPDPLVMALGNQTQAVLTRGKPQPQGPSACPCRPLPRRGTRRPKPPVQGSESSVSVGNDNRKLFLHRVSIPYV